MFRQAGQTLWRSSKAFSSGSGLMWLISLSGPPVIFSVCVAEKLRGYNSKSTHTQRYQSIVSRVHRQDCKSSFCPHQTNSRSSMLSRARSMRRRRLNMAPGWSGACHPRRLDRHTLACLCLAASGRQVRSG
jgi:hypothetical protein